MMRSGLKDTTLDNGSGVGGVLRQDGGDSDGGNLDGGNLDGGNLDGGNSNCGKLDTGDTTLAAMEAVVTARVSSKQSIFFRFELKQTETQSVSVVFRFVSRNQKTFFWFILVCFGVSDQYRNNRNKQNFLETNRKNLQKRSLLGGPQNR
jgi:hypothetical protein